MFNWDPVVSPNGLTLGRQPSIFGHPVFTSTQLAAATVYLGNFNDLLIGEWGSMILEPSTEASTAFEAHQLWVKGIMEIDIAVRRAASFVQVGDLS